MSEYIDENLEQSLSARRAWIEIDEVDGIISGTTGRSPQGERGLKFPPDAQYQTLYGRSPQGERGLKYVLREGLKVPGLVALRKESVD